MRAALATSLVLAAFAIANTAASLLALALGRAVRGHVGGLGARARAASWLGLLFFPAGAAVLAAALVATAFAQYEPQDAHEVPGPALLLAGATGAWLLAASIRRVVCARRATRRFLAERVPAARPVALLGAPAPVLCVRPAFPAVALVGLSHPRLLLAESALEALAPDELAVVLAHEAAHVRAGDNFKSLLAEAAAWPFGLGAATLRAWRQASEELADERAARGSSDRALCLASALVKVARAAPASVPLRLAATTFHRGEGLARRVNRLLAGEAALGAANPTPLPSPAVLWALVGLGLAAGLPRTLPPLYRVVEEVVRILS